MTALAGTPTLPQERLWLWRLGFPIVRALAGFLCPWRLEGAENVPPSGPISPFAVSGTKDARLGRFWRRDILFRAGAPFRVGDLGLSSDDPQAIADAIMRRVAELLPTEMRGVYMT